MPEEATTQQIIPTAEQLFADNIGFAHRLAGWHVRRFDLRGYEKECARQAALLGLWRASTKYGAQHVMAFEVFAFYYIRNEFGRARRERSGRPARFLRLDIPDAEGVTPQLPDPKAGRELRQAEDREYAHALVATLPPRLRRVLIRHVCEGWTLEAVGRAEGFTMERARQLIEMALERLRRRARAR